MSRKDLARRTDMSVFIANVDITSSIKRHLISLSYTDNEDEADDLQLKLADRDSLWLEKWFNTVVDAAASVPRVNDGKDDDDKTTSYKVTAAGGVTAHLRPDSSYAVTASLAYGTIVKVKSISGGWANIEYGNGISCYVLASCLTEVSSETSSDTGEPVSKGLDISASIVLQNEKSDGKDKAIDCGHFELDNIDFDGPPASVNIKCTSLSFRKSVRQTKKSRSWESYYLSGILAEMAGNSGMAYMFLAENDPFYARTEQIDTSDIAFLTQLAHNAGASIKVSANILIIYNADGSGNSIRTITKGDGSYLKWKLNSGEADTKYHKCHVSYTDPVTGRVIEGTASTGEKAKDGENEQILEIKAKVGSPAEAKALAEKKLELANRFENTASFTLPGDPYLLAGCVVTLDKWGAFNGEYVIYQARHSVSRSGYTTQISLRKK
ncbi:MAG: hypothetical protein E7671_00520 [Ruminococcaceae bacterium]|nr:hypothetical protein [Oscillospiraceae bacterium]